MSGTDREGNKNNEAVFTVMYRRGRGGGGGGAVGGSVGRVDLRNRPLICRKSCFRLKRVY